MSAQLVRDGLAHQPQCILGQPAVRSLGLVQLEFLAQQEAQAIEQLALQGVLGCRQCLAGIAAEFLGYRGLVGLHDQLAERASVLVLAGQHVQERGPQVGVVGEPVEDAWIEQPGVEQSGGGAVQPVLALLAIAEAVRPPQRAVPGMPDRAVRILHVQIDGDLANVVQQRRIGGAGRPGFGLGRLCLRRGAGGQQVRLPQLQGVGDDL
mmetsp:Transcript_21056/g.81528  ORF Transcript_21056/g.81528 Transcript_21056/m.81528 type:complete len:208 (-) Transcript_21056:13245-13868(-)